MPRVSPEHSEARRQQILTAARTCFLRDGFHQTSMQDIQREAGLSAGAIYLYFKSKREIVLGIAGDILGTVGDVFPGPEMVGHGGIDLAGMIESFLRKADAMDRERSIFRIALLVWAEAIRDPELLVALQASIAGLRAQIVALMVACQAEGLANPEADPEAMAVALLGFGQGFIIQRSLLDPEILPTYVAGVAALLRHPEPVLASLTTDETT